MDGLLSKYVLNARVRKTTKRSRSLTSPHPPQKRWVVTSFQTLTWNPMGYTRSPSTSPDAAPEIETWRGRSCLEWVAIQGGNRLRIPPF